MTHEQLTMSRSAVFAAYLAQSQIDVQAAYRFAVLLDAWRSGGDVTWAELMAAWVEMPVAYPSPETIKTMIKCLNAK